MIILFLLSLWVFWCIRDDRNLSTILERFLEPITLPRGVTHVGVERALLVLHALEALRELLSFHRCDSIFLLALARLVRVVPASIVAPRVVVTTIVIVPCITSTVIIVLSSLTLIVCCFFLVL